MYATEITAHINLEFPRFELTVDFGGDLGEYDGDRDYVGVFDDLTEKEFDVTFYGPTAAHVIGLAHLYAGKLTEGGPYLLETDVVPEIEMPRLP